MASGVSGSRADRFMNKAWLEALFEWRAVRWLAGAAFMARAAGWAVVGRPYRALVDVCWVARVSNVAPWRGLAESIVFRIVDRVKRTGRNPVIDWYRADGASRECAHLFSLTGRGSADLLRDLIVLKSPSDREKGVILLKYARTFSAVVALLDLERLMDRYQFVLEPCWAGYCDPALLLFVTASQPVVVQCFTHSDHEFVRRLGYPMIPVRLGPADWVDADAFDLPQVPEKQFDLVMVANWAPHKRHALLFKALQSLGDRDVRVLLVGFPWADRSADDVRREVAAFPNDRVSVRIVEQVPHAELARLLRQCKVFVFLSKKEGDNKALVEAMFAGVPAIVYDRTVGGASSRINAATGVLAAERELPEKIRYMLDHHMEFSPRQWALEHTGAKVATRLVDNALREAALRSGGDYRSGIVEKINAPNLAYKVASDRERFRADYDFALSCRLAAR